MSLINYVFYILLVGPLWIQYYLSSNKLVSSYKVKITLLFKVLPSYNISGLLTRHTLWYHIWDDLKDKNDDELEYFLNKIFPTANNQKSKLFDCDNPHKYVHYKQENHEEILFPDSSYYKWISSNAKMELKNMTIFSDNFNVLPKTSEFQKKLFQHQNPMTCEGKRFIELPINDWGLGAVLIHLARKFIMSVNHGYIPIISRRKWIWTSGANFCTKDKTYTCFFQEISNCTQYYYKHPHLKQRLTYLGNRLPPPFHFPLWMEEFLNETPIYNSLESFLYYSEAQVLAYLMRPKQKLIQWMDDYIKKDPLPFQQNNKNNIDVSMHIRHGDKGSEMKLIPTMEYMKAVNIIQRLEKKKDLRIFISTEDQDAIEELRNSTQKVHILAFNHERENGGYFTFKNNATDVALISFLNLRECLRSKYFVGTVKSCWSFVTNALRNTVGFHSNEIYFEVGQETCLSVCHCKMIGLPHRRPYTWGIW